MTERKSNPAIADRSLVLTRVFDAPRRLVFEAWTKAEHLAKWSAPRGFTLIEQRADCRPGGAWDCVMVMPDGTRLPLGGVYREIVQDELLVFTHTWKDEHGVPEHETLVTVRFADENGKTRVTLEQGVFKSAESRDGHNGGWSECFDRLAELLRTIQS
jgi:uncharacterized protein YndB with AHSA1/START domain